MNLLYEFAARSIAGDHFLVPIGAAARRFSGLFALNETAAFLWHNLKETRSTQELAELLYGEFEVVRETAHADTAEFLQILRHMGLLE